jgi:dolichyl-phosphate-mannose--protein O-mannosyl transferase
MLDMPAVFFGTAAIVSAWMVTRESLNSYIRWGAFGLITGLLSGFAVSTKLNAGVIPLVVMVIGIYCLYTGSKTPAFRRQFSTPQ